MDIGERIRKFRKNKGLSVESLSKKTGISRATLFRYENGEILKIPFENLKIIAAEIGVATEKLLNFENDIDEIETHTVAPLNIKKIPILGKIACGLPLFAESNVEDYLPVPESMEADFILRCQGDSMINARITDGDIVYVKSQSHCEDGKIVVAMIDDNATLKRIYRYPGHVVLQPENPKYPPMVYSESDFESISILGIVIGFTSFSF